MTKLKPRWRRVLRHRSTKNKIAVARDCELLPVGDLPIVAELVRENIMVFVERTVLQHLVIVGPGTVSAGVYADVYQLTEKGISLCDKHGIEQI